MEIFLGIIVLMSLICFVLYFVDKQKAIHNKWRISEKALLLVSFLGGAIGATIGMYTFRHKTKHWYFVVVNFLSLIIHVVIGVYLYTKVGFIYL